MFFSLLFSRLPGWRCLVSRSFSAGIPVRARYAGLRLSWVVVVAAGCPVSLLAVTARAAPLTAAQAAQASRLLSSEKPAEREAAYKGFRAQGVEVREAYRAVLEKVQAQHRERLKTRVSTSLTALRRFEPAHKEWMVARDACLDLIFKKTDKDSKKTAELARSYSAAEKAMKELSKHLKSVPGGLETWESAGNAVNEIEGELAWCRDAPESDQEYFREQHARARAAEVTGGEEFLKLVPLWQERREAQAALETATRFNEKEIRWPAPVLREFMLLINARRYAVGQQPLRLDERLSRCAYGHSEAMMRLKFFSHESPVEGHKTPWDRAKAAEFEGNCTGENIFMGSTSAEAAFMAWWHSDGHRFIMFQKDANTLGLGLAGNYWTLNTGNRKWPVGAEGAGAK